MSKEENEISQKIDYTINEVKNPREQISLKMK